MATCVLSTHNIIQDTTVTHVTMYCIICKTSVTLFILHLFHGYMCPTQSYEFADKKLGGDIVVQNVIHPTPFCKRHVATGDQKHQ